MNKTTLVIMAAGIGSRFGKGIKQLAKVGPSSELIMDYSVYDAIAAGFDRVVFIIRRDIEAEFREAIGQRIEAVADVAYVFQDPDDLPAGFSYPEGREKPWGTGQAVLAARGEIDGPFAVINADDYYGRVAFQKMHKYLTESEAETDGRHHIAMMGYRLGNTLSENGSVTRGVCSLDERGGLAGINETRHIIKCGEGAAVESDGIRTPLDPDARVSMNFWGLQADFVGALEEGLEEFLSDPARDLLRDEYLLPIYIDELLKADRAKVDVLQTEDHWFGVTYQEDSEKVKDALLALHRDGVYPASLY